MNLKPTGPALHYVGFDLHRRTIAVCVKTADGTIVEQQTLPARRPALLAWAQSRTTPWTGDMEATIFTGWVYDLLKPMAFELKAAHPLMLRAIIASKKKNDRVDARKLADALRCDLLPECYIAPGPIRELRRMLRYRNLVLRQAVRMKNKIAGLMMERGVEYDAHRLHGNAYFAALLDTLDDVPQSVVDLLRLSRSLMLMFNKLQQRLLRALTEHRDIEERVQRLMTIPGVGEVTALTWALEVGEVERLGSVSKACSYCGLTSAQSKSGGKSARGPISKQRNKHLQSVLIEAAKLAPQRNTKLKEIYELEITRGHRNRATLILARKLVAYLLAVDRSGRPFEQRPQVSLCEAEALPGA